MFGTSEHLGGRGSLAEPIRGWRNGVLTAIIFTGQADWHLVDFHVQTGLLSIQDQTSCATGCRQMANNRHIKGGARADHLVHAVRAPDH